MQWTELAIHNKKGLENYFQLALKLRKIVCRFDRAEAGGNFFCCDQMNNYKRRDEQNSLFVFRETAFHLTGSRSQNNKQNQKSKPKQFGKRKLLHKQKS